VAGAGALIPAGTKAREAALGAFRGIARDLTAGALAAPGKRHYTFRHVAPPESGPLGHGYANV
jgi:hypothetical protein